MKCDLCGTESDFDAGFIKQPRSLSSETRNICPTCWIKRSNTRLSNILLAIPLLALGGYALQRLVPGTFVGHLLLNCGLAGVFLILVIIPHEFGHAMVARVLGWQVPQIVIGLGKPVWKRRWQGTLLELRSLPLGGATLMFPKDTRWFRLKFFLSVLAGPAVNAAMALGALLIWNAPSGHLDFDALPNAAGLFVLTNAWVVVVNLWPHQPKTGFGVGSDGARLLQLLSSRQRVVDEVQAMRFAFEANICREQADLSGARHWCDQGLALYPDNSYLLNLSGVNYLEEEHYEDAREVFLRLLEQEKPATSLRALLLNNLAYADALSENPAWLSEADAYSRDAYTMVPWMAGVAGTRGTVLVALGRFQEGIELLRKSLADANTPRNKADTAGHLAVALARSGQANEALKYWQLARELDPKSPMLRRAEVAIQAAKRQQETPPGPVGDDVRSL